MYSFYLICLYKHTRRISVSILLDVYFVQRDTPAVDIRFTRLKMVYVLFSAIKKTNYGKLWILLQSHFWPHIWVQHVRMFIVHLLQAANLNSRKFQMRNFHRKFSKINGIIGTLIHIFFSLKHKILPFPARASKFISYTQHLCATDKWQNQTFAS